MKSIKRKGREDNASNLLFQSFIEQSPVSVQIHSMDGRLVNSNPAYAKLYTLNKEALAGLYEKYNILEDTQAVELGITPYILKTFAGETVSFPEYEYDVITTLKKLNIKETASKKVWLKTQGFPLKDEDGKLTHAVFFSEDITAQKKAEIASIESEQKFKDLFEQSPLVYEIYDRDGVMVDANVAFENLWQLKKEDLIGKYKVLESEQIKTLGFLPHFEKAYAGERADIKDLEFDATQEEVTKGGGRKRWISNMLYPIKDVKGEVTHVVMIHEDLTERKIAEKELQESHFFTDNLIQSANMMIVGIDEEGKVNIFNPAAERISGYSHDEIKDKDWFSTLVPIEKYPEVYEEFDRLIEGGTPKLFENPILAKNGEERIISWTNNEIVKDNKPAGIISFGIDITEQKKAEKEFLRSEERFRMLFTNSQNGILFADTKTRQFKYANPAAAQMLMYTQEELCNMGVKDIHPRSSLGRVFQEFEAQIKGESNFASALPCLRKDKSIIYADVSANILTTSEGEFRVGFFTNVTEYIKTEEEKKQIFDLSSDLIGIAGFDGFFKQLNPAWETTLGYSFGELRSKPLFDFIHPDDVQKTTAEVNKLAMGQKTINFENRYFHKDGSFRYISWAATPLVSEKTIYCIGRDITESKKHEKELKESEEKFRLLVEQSPFSIQIFNTDGHLDQVNESFKKLWGINEESIQDVLDNYNVLEDEEADKLGVKKGIQKAFNGESIVLPMIEYDASNTMEAMGAGIAANKRWVQARFYPIKYDKGEVVKVISMEEDMTESMQAQLELQNSEEKFRELMEQAPYAISIVNPDGRIDQVNLAFMKLWGFTAEAWPVIKDNYNFLEDEEAIRLGTMPLIEKAFKGEFVELPLIEYISKNMTDKIGIETTANRRWVQVRLYPIKNSNGDIVKVVDIAEDVTDRIESEKQILQYQQSLKDLALELTYAEEKQRKQIATDLHDDVGQLLASARLQIAAVNSNMEKKDILGKMKDISQGLLEAIQATRNAIFELSPPQLNEIGLVAALSDWMEEEVEAKHGIETSLLGRDQIYAISEQVRYLLFRCVREMLINVIKHAKATQVSLNILDENEILYITVQDNGIGFDHRPDIVGIKHTGFGLFSIHERIKNIGGSMNIDTAPGKGTIITLNLSLNK